MRSDQIPPREWTKDEQPSCDRDQKHCAHRDSFQHSVMNHLDEACCHCGATRCVTLERDPSHGKYAQNVPLIRRGYQKWGKPRELPTDVCPHCRTPAGEHAPTCPTPKP